MSYKQERNPFNGPASFRNPKNRGTSNFNALEFQMPDLSQILNKSADGEDKTVDVTNESTTGTSDEGKVGKDTPVKSSTDITLQNAKKEDAPTYKDRVEADKEKRRQLNQDIREARRMKKDRSNILTDEQREKSADAFSSLKDKRKFDRGARKDNISVEQALINEAEAQKVAAAEAEKEKLKKEEERKQSIETADYWTDKFNPTQEEGSGFFNKRGAQPEMNTKNMKQVNRKGKGFPMVNPATQVDQMGNPIPQPPVKGTMANGGRPLNSNVLVNDPMNYQDPSKVSAQQHNQNMRMNEIAHSAGTPTPRYNPYNNEMTGMAFNAKLRAASAAGDLDDNPNFKAAVDKAPSMVHVDPPGSLKPMASAMRIKDKPKKEGEEKKEVIKLEGNDDAEGNPKPLKAVGMYGDDKKEKRVMLVGPDGLDKDGNPKPLVARGGGAMYNKDHAHTKVTKDNLKATERDDAAHMSYLKRDVKDIQKSKMSQHKKDEYETADEKHISKLAGDLKYDTKYHGRKYDNV